MPTALIAGFVAVPNIVDVVAAVVGHSACRQVGGFGVDVTVE